MAVTTAANQILQTEAYQRDGQLPDLYWEVVGRYRTELVNQALAIVGSLQDAEDVVQETFCEAFRQPERLTEARSLGAFLRTINRANALDQLRKVKKSSSSQRSEADSESAREAGITGGFGLMETREAVAKAIEDLPPKYRPVVILRYWESLKCREIADRLDLPAGTVRWLIAEATEVLHGKLAKYLDGSKG